MKQRRNSEYTIWLLRHGESTWNASGLVQGQADGPTLNATGRAQVAAAADIVKRLHINSIISSDLERAEETATIIGERLNLAWSRDADLRERDFGKAQGRPVDDLKVEWSGIDDGRVVDADARPPEGESLHELGSRVDHFFSRLTEEEHDGDVLVVTHGGFIRIALAKCDGVPVSEMTWGQAPNVGLWSLGLYEICSRMLSSV